MLWVMMLYVYDVFAVVNVFIYDDFVVVIATVIFFGSEKLF